MADGTAPREVVEAGYGIPANSRDRQAARGDRHRHLERSDRARDEERADGGVQTEPFAAISAFYVIEHVERDHHAEVFARLHRWLVPGGYLLFTIEPEDQPGSVGEWLGRPMYFSQHDADTTLRLLRDVGFDVVDTAIEDQREGDREVTYMWVLAQRGESGA